MQGVILVGGLGTRLGDLVRERPKPLLPVAGKPFIEHLLTALARHGVADVLLLAGYRADVVQQLYGPGSDARARFGIDITVAVEETPLGTAGALHSVRHLLRDRFLLLNGDSLFDINLLDLCLPAAVAGPAPLVTMALRDVADARRYGIVDTDGGYVTAFREKPAELRPGRVNAGIYYLNASVLDRFEPGPRSLERDVLPLLAADGRIAGKVYDGYFIDIGIPGDLTRADRELAAVLTRPAAFFDRDDTLIHDRGYIHKPEDLEWFDGVPAMIKRLNDSGVLVFIVTNQAGVAKGHFDEQAVRDFHAHFAAQLRAFGAHIDDWRYCPHHEDGVVAAYRKRCDWRKPGAGMLLDLLARWPVDRAASVMFGNNDTDVAAGVAAGVTARLVPPGRIVEVVGEYFGPRPAPAAG